jgi:hypothetical protein
MAVPLLAPGLPFVAPLVRRKPWRLLWDIFRRHSRQPCPLGRKFEISVRRPTVPLPKPKHAGWPTILACASCRRNFQPGRDQNPHATATGRTRASRPTSRARRTQYPASQSDVASPLDRRGLVPARAGPMRDCLSCWSGSIHGAQEINDLAADQVGRFVLYPMAYIFEF